MLEGRPATFYITFLHVGIVVCELLFKLPVAPFIPPLFFTGAWWQVFTAPFAFIGPFNFVFSLISFAFLGNETEHKFSTEKFLSVTALGLLITFLISSVCFYIPVIQLLSFMFTGFGPIVVFWSAIYTFTTNKSRVGYNSFTIPIGIYPYFSLLAYLIFNKGLCGSEIAALIAGFIFPSLFPNLIRPNIEKKDEIENHGSYWSKKPSSGISGAKKFTGKGRRIE